MFKILIADDERMIRKGLCNIIEKNIALPLVITEAENGLEAVEKVIEEQPDLIITDINMPGLNGLDFIREINQQQVDTTVIILSGYESFDYAREAISLGVKEYINKPIKKVAFIEMIKEHVFKITQNRQQRSQNTLYHKESAKMLSEVKKSALIGYLDSESKAEEQKFLEQLELMNVILDSQMYTCMVIQYEVVEHNYDFIDFAIKNILDEYFSLNTERYCMSITYELGTYLAIFKTNGAEVLSDRLKEILLSGVRIAGEYSKIQLFAGISDVAVEVRQLKKVFKQALTAAEHKLFDQASLICLYADIQWGESIAMQPSSPELNYLHIVNELNEIRSYGRTGNVIKALKQAYQQHSELILLQLKRKKINADELLLQPKDFSHLWSIDEMKKELKRQLQLLETSAVESSSLNRSLAERIINYVDEHITEDIGLTTIAEHFKLSPGYIGNVFTRHVQVSFNAYVIQKRIDLAKKLLQSNEYSIKAITRACGFSNAKYFSVVFKKYENITPREYRNTCYHQMRNDGI